jgi:predicted MFS family arabinose efflux permease
LLLAMAATGLAIGSLETLWQPRFAVLFDGYQGNTFWFGALGAAAFLGAAAGSLTAPWVAKRLGGSSANGAMAAQVAVGLTIVVLGAAGRVPLAATAFTVAYVFVGIRSPLHEEMLHGRVSGDGRSTMLSLDSLALQLGGISGTAIAGLMAGAFGIPATWTIVGAVTALSGLLYLSVGRRSGGDSAGAAVEREQTSAR